MIGTVIRIDFDMGIFHIPSAEIEWEDGSTSSHYLDELLYEDAKLEIGAKVLRRCCRSPFAIQKNETNPILHSIHGAIFPKDNDGKDIPNAKPIAIYRIDHPKIVPIVDVCKGLIEDCSQLIDDLSKVGAQ
jgi:hypothetical protein